jgi:hypothetical protein
VARAAKHALAGSLDACRRPGNAGKARKNRESEEKRDLGTQIERRVAEQVSDQNRCCQARTNQRYPAEEPYGMQHASAILPTRRPRRKTDV